MARSILSLKEDIKRLRSDGKTYNQIAAELSCSKAVISYHLNPITREKTVLRQRRRFMKMPNKRKINKKLIGSIIGSLITRVK